MQQSIKMQMHFLSWYNIYVTKYAIIVMNFVF